MANFFSWRLLEVCPCLGEERRLGNVDADIHREHRKRAIRSAAPFEKLHRALVPLCRSATFERAEIFSFAGFLVFLARIESIFAG
jgi:hypothetical protein